MKELAWLRSLAMSGLFLAAERLAEGVKITGGNVGFGVASMAVAASVVSNYLTNRANSQREAQADRAERQELAKRNHHLRRGMAASLRRGLMQARHELSDLPADPYHELFSSWDYILGLASTDEETLDRFFPTEFTESHWEAINPYSSDLNEDAEALAGLLRMLLEADAIYKEWREEPALYFAKRALPYYRQAFADALAGDSDGFLYRAFQIRGVNQIRFLVEKFIIENREGHATTHRELQEMRREDREAHAITHATLEDIQRNLQLVLCLRKKSGVKQTANSAVPEEYLDIISFELDSTFRPEIYGGILNKLREDLRQGALTTSITYRRAHQKAEADLRAIHKYSVERLAFLDIATVSKDSWWGKPPQASIKVLRDIVESLGCPILVNCSSVNVAAYAVLKGFDRHGIASEIIPDDASGREQAISLAINPAVDFVVCADAPLFLDDHENVKAYSKLFEIYNENQAILKKIGSVKADTPKVHVYQASSAAHQLLLERARTVESPLPKDLEEEPLFNMAEFASVSKVMRPNDMTIAWGALKESLLKDLTLVKVEGTDFALTVSMFCNPDWHARADALRAILDLFVAEWNFCESHEKVTFERLVADQRFMDSFARGGGFKTKFLHDSK